MRPGQAPGVADQHRRDAVEAAPGDVELAGDRDVSLIQALSPVPGKVRVAEHHAAPVRRRLLAQPVGVGAAVEREELSRLAGEQLIDGPVALCPRCLDSRRRAGRRGIGDARDCDPGARQASELVEAPVDVELRDRAHPIGAAAALVGKAVDTDVGEVVVVAGDVAADHLLQLGQRPLRGRAGHQVLDQSRVVDLGVEEVGVEVVDDGTVAGELPRGVGAEVARALAGNRDVAVGDRAEVVGGEGVGVAEAR